jgi:hypothetical protein
MSLECFGHSGFSRLPTLVSFFFIFQTIMLRSRRQSARTPFSRLARPNMPASLRVPISLSNGKISPTSVLAHSRAAVHALVARLLSSSPPCTPSLTAWLPHPASCAPLSPCHAPSPAAPTRAHCMPCSAPTYVPSDLASGLERNLLVRGRLAQASR